MGELIDLLLSNLMPFDALFLKIIDYVGTFAFAISGIRLASTKQFDLFGAFVVGLITAIGGGTLRDLLLDKTVFWMVQPQYFIATFAALVSTIIFRRYVVKMEYTLFIFDTVGLGLFTVVGITTTLEAGHNMFIAILLGTITGSAGGVIRDMILNEIPLLFRKDIYALACVSGGLVYYLCQFVEINVVTTQLLTMSVVMITRIVARKTNYSIPQIKLLDFEEKKSEK